MKTVVLANRGSGSGVDRKAVAKALDEAEIAAEPQWLEGSALARAAQAAVADGAQLVIAGGGDGTISTVAAAVAGTRCVLGVLPLGTLNHFARDLAIPLDLSEAARLIAGGQARSVDIAEVNGRAFINNSAIGLYPLMVSERQAQQRRLGGRKRAALAVAALRILAGFTSNRLSLTISGRRAAVETPLLFVGNNDYRLEVPGAGTRERLDRGELSVFVLRRKSRLGFLWATIRTLFGWGGNKDVARFDRVKHLRVESSRRRLAVSLDGESVQMQPPLDYRIRPKALRVIA